MPNLFAVRSFCEGDSPANLGFRSFLPRLYGESAVGSIQPAFHRLGVIEVALENLHAAPLQLTHCIPLGMAHERPHGEPSLLQMPERRPSLLPCGAGNGDCSVFVCWHSITLDGNGREYQGFGCNQIRVPEALVTFRASIAGSSPA